MVNPLRVVWEQFIDGTWREFMREDGFNWFGPDVKQRQSSCEFVCVAWYMHKNAKAFGIDPSKTRIGLPAVYTSS